MAGRGVRLNTRGRQHFWPDAGLASGQLLRILLFWASNSAGDEDALRPQFA